MGQICVQCKTYVQMPDYERMVKCISLPEHRFSISVAHPLIPC